MAIRKIGKIWLGDGDLQASGYSELSSGSAAPLDVDGADGDVYIRIAGANSNILIKRNGTWVGLVNVAINVTIPDNTTDFVWLSMPAAAARFMKINYGIIRNAGSQSGEIGTINDLATADIAEYGLNELGTDVGVTFNAQINGANIELLATTDSQGVSAALKYLIRNWS